MSSQNTGLGYFNSANYPPGKQTNMGPPASMPSMSSMGMGNFNTGMGLVRSNAFKKGGKYGRRTRHRRRHAKKSMRRMRRSRRR
jgi:hypothetical protein